MSTVDEPAPVRLHTTEAGSLRGGVTQVPHRRTSSAGSPGACPGSARSLRRLLAGVLAMTSLVTPGLLAGASPASAAVTTITTVSNDGIPDTWDWRRSHDEGGACNDRIARPGGTALLTRNWAAGCEDGLDPRESTAGANNGRFEVRDALMTNIKDDGVENDHFMPGLVVDSLFDGVWTFLSEQRSGTTANTIGAGESPYIDVVNTHVRLFTTNAGEIGPGRWFKWKGEGAPNHRLRISGSTFAVSQQPRSGWSSLAIPAGTQWLGTGNHILWLGEGSYGGPRPAGVTFLSGAAAVAKWQEVRNRFYTDHGLPVRAADDLDPRRWTPHTSSSTPPPPTSAPRPSAPPPPAPTAAPPPATSGGARVVDVPVRATSDDAEQRRSGSVRLTSGDLNLAQDGSAPQRVGLRFTGLAVPRGARVTRAHVQFTVDEVSTAASRLVIAGQASNDPARFTAATGDLAAGRRPLTRATVSWAPPAWTTAGARTARQRTPDLRAVVQELVQRRDWTSGDPLVLVVTGTGERTAESFDGGARKAPVLHVEFTAR